MQQQLLIVTGKGGVGKSAVAAALAIEAARRGRKVLAIGMVEKRGLAAHLGVETLTYEIGEVRPGIFAMGIERPAALDEYLRIVLRVPKLSRIGPVARAFDALASAAPGIRETVTMGKVLFETRTNNWDLVVADAPPSGAIGSHIRAPKTVSELVGAGKVREQTKWMSDLMADRTRTGLVMVTLAEELPTIETAETLDWIANEELISVAEVITNRILEPLGAKVPVDVSSPMGAAAALHDGIFHEQQKWLAELPGRGRALPYLFGVTGPVEVAERLADVLEPR
ncbi:MAG: AAA family ATPase [Acidimicrobiia bacterium]|nr:AAA family ATPase [Acidimicrobiia bacterium]MDH5502765.1 AAA family ATPase [Acidimicrobiia bacterium]